MEAHPHAHVEHHKTGHRLLDMVVSVCALVTSVVSILLAFHTGHNMEKLVHANSWPALQLNSTNNSSGGRQLSFELVNAGVGPAQIYSLELVFDGKAIPWAQGASLQALLDACCADAVRKARAAVGTGWEPHLLTLPVAGSFLSPRESTVAFHWPRTDADAAPWDELDRARISRRVTMRVCYCSVFDECWIAETGKFPPRPVPACPAVP